MTFRELSINGFTCAVCPTFMSNTLTGMSADFSLITISECAQMRTLNAVYLFSSTKVFYTEFCAADWFEFCLLIAQGMDVAT